MGYRLHEANSHNGSIHQTDAGQHTNENILPNRYGRVLCICEICFEPLSMHGICQFDDMGFYITNLMRNYPAGVVQIFLHNTISNIIVRKIIRTVIYPIWTMQQQHHKDSSYTNSLTIHIIVRKLIQDHNKNIQQTFLHSSKIALSLVIK